MMMMMSDEMLIKKEREKDGLAGRTRISKFAYDSLSFAGVTLMTPDFPSLAGLALDRRIFLLLLVLLVVRSTVRSPSYYFLYY